jgi:hypothetical protein
MTAVLEAPVRRTFAPRGLGWLMWRQLRLVVWGVLALVLVGAVAALWQHGQQVEFIRSHHIAGCAMISQDPDCQQPGLQQAVQEFRDTYGIQLKLAGVLLLLVPVTVGAGLGAPLLGQELEQGTWKLVLTQAVTRRRWVLAKLAASGLLVAVATGMLALLYRWAWQPSANDVSGIGWYDPFFFSTGGPDLVATALLALAVGALAGALLRRTLAAMPLTVLVVGAVQIALDLVRPYLWSWHTVLVSRSELPNSTWGFAQGFMRPDGTRLPYDGCGPVANQSECLAKYVNAVEYTDLHRATEYWPMQTVETLLCLGLAAALAAFTVSWVRRRLA